MRYRVVTVLGIVGMLALGVIPAAAHTLTVTLNSDCNCTYSVSVAGNTDAGASVTVDYSFIATENGTPHTITGSISTIADATTGDYSASQSGLPLTGLTCGGSVTFSGGSATLTFNGTTEGPAGFTVDLPQNLSCGGTPPGKALEIGPSSMEGHLLIRPGDWISGGYSFKFVNGGHVAETVTVHSTLTIPFKCPGGGGGSFVIDLGTHNYFVPAMNTDWQPTGDANSVLSWAGSGLAPDGCSGAVMDNSKGAIFDATISQNPDTGQLLNWRFKYRDPNAKGKGNVNCLDTSDPRRAKADVCGASWSETVRDP
jgi:hypothetical protein